ncbi:protein phosphatase 1 regulatory subunit 3G-like [Haliotis rubra]|uniref:protein phosphatase 1 regulatory subunit 3G-like n=1 Tax=Haliotis rubra TaxID=36100 RepID=UPI001EE55B27|nr:protein phosphatase 1 regulatory subunit 3G-like [Haliotis rubra]XP_046570802.1 protein phosphatase 1 regulatory subunit 3G-like [Haliotis rubra]XP_046570803.1 protein phosphatase 1 regulatory subunit 3G-like [Haliotis rubra]
MHCDSEDDMTVFLPRNLSYVRDSSLDEYSVSSAFVQNPRERLRDCIECSECMHLLEAMAEEGGAASKQEMQDYGSSVDPEEKPVTERQASLTETVGSDTPSEEGIFVNVIDDELDHFASAINGGHEIDDHSGDSVYSPDGSDLGDTQEGHKERLEEAVKTIANSDFIAKPELKIKINDRPFLETTTEEAFLKFVSSKSPVYEDKEFNFSRSELRKSSSLKTNKTPPGTPSRKKVVRFADAMGLDLECVRNIVNVDTPPKVPASALADLRVGLEEDRRGMGSRFLTACFSQPGASENFMKKVLAQKVSLENAVITGMTITGVIRVANISFNKMVRVRYSTNNWATFHDIAASYVQNSCDGPTDRFSFSIVAPANFDVGSRLEFAVSYAASCTVFWDNNEGRNYVFECFAKTVPTEAENSWMHFLAGVEPDPRPESSVHLQVPSC